MEGVVVEMPIDNDVKEILDNHESRIYKVELTMEAVKENQSQMKTSIDKLENTILTGNNIMLGTLNQLVLNKENAQSQLNLARENNNTTKNISKMDNKTKIIVAAFTFLGILAGVIGGKVLV